MDTPISQETHDLVLTDENVSILDENGNGINEKALLDMYKKHENVFKSTTIKNDKVWLMISNTEGSHTTEQCKNEFKYLKQKYIDKKDNMGKKASGAAATKFNNFNEMEEIFAQDPNVVPVCTASSSRVAINADVIHESTDNSDETRTSLNVDGKEYTKRRKVSNLERKLDHFEETLHEREDLKSERQKEALERQDRALDIMQRMANSMAAMTNKD